MMASHAICVQNPVILCVKFLLWGAWTSALHIFLDSWFSKGHGPWMYKIVFNVYRCFFCFRVVRSFFSKLWRYDTMSMTVNVRHRHRCHPTEQYTKRFATSNWSRFIQVHHKKAVFGKNRCKFTYTNKEKSVLTKKIVYLVLQVRISIQMYTYLFTCCMNVK